MSSTKPLFTLHDAREERLLYEARREHARAVREARAKVNHWEAQVARFGGGVIHVETLARMRAELAKLLAS